MRAFLSTVVRRATAALLLTTVVITSAAAQGQATEIRAVTFVAPPFVMKQGDQLTGFCIDLWNEIAARLNIKTNLEVLPSTSSVLVSMRGKDADLVVAPIMYTAERDREFDFSYPVVQSGLQILVRGARESGSPAPLQDFLTLLFSRWSAMWLVVALMIILIPGHLMWLIDRGSEGSVSPDRKYIPGIFHGLNWAATALVSQVMALPKNWLARILGLVWMYAGVVFIALYTAQLTATLTTERIRGAISDVADLPGKRVATIRNSSPAQYLRTIGAQVQEFETTDEMFAALLNQRADAVFFNAEVLRYFAAHDGLGRVSVVGPEVDSQDLGFLFQLNSPLRKKVGGALIAMREDGTYQRIYEKWFGKEE